MRGARRRCGGRFFHVFHPFCGGFIGAFCFYLYFWLYPFSHSFSHNGYNYSYLSLSIFLFFYFSLFFFSSFVICNLAGLWGAFEKLLKYRESTVGLTYLPKKKTFGSIFIVFMTYALVPSCTCSLCPEGAVDGSGGGDGEMNSPDRTGFSVAPGFVRFCFSLGTKYPS